MSDVVVFFDGDVIKKVISHYKYRHPESFEHREFETVLQTKNRQVILPKTGRGKEKKLNFTSITTPIPAGCELKLNFGSHNSLWVGNPRNALSLPLPGEHKYEKIEDFQLWRDAYIADSPSNHFEKVERMRNTPHRTIKYFIGDIFRFEIDREQDGFGLIIGQVRKMQKDGIIPERHVLNDTMCVPLLVRLYRIKTKDCDMSIEYIISMPLLHAEIMADGCVIWGSVDIVGSKQLNADDIDFPVQVGKSINVLTKLHVRLCWGIGMVFTEQVNGFPKGFQDGLFVQRFLGNGVDGGVNSFSVEADLRGESPRRAWCDICHPDNVEFKNAAYRFFNVPFDITFDEFNTKYGGMTRQQYAEYANQYLRPKQKKSKKS
jgi:hypothetical protein